MGMSLRHKENITNIRKVYFGCIMRSEKLERVTTEKICGKKDRGRQHEKSLLTIMDMCHVNGDDRIAKVCQQGIF